MHRLADALTMSASLINPRRKSRELQTRGGASDGVVRAEITSTPDTPRPLDDPAGLARKGDAHQSGY